MRRRAGRRRVQHHPLVPVRVVQRLTVEVEPADNGMAEAFAGRPAGLHVPRGPEVTEPGASGQEPVDEPTDADVARQVTPPGDGPTGVFLSENGGTHPW